MRLSTKGRFAVTAMIDIALHENFAPVSLSDIALRQQVSLSYLEQIFSLLRHRDLVASVPERHTGSLREGMFSFALLEVDTDSTAAPRPFRWLTSSERLKTLRKK